ncbi:MAG: 6-phosphogluconolactonase [Acidimicrobiales bacterium]
MTGADHPPDSDRTFGRVLVGDDPAVTAAALVAERGRTALAERGRFVLALSGGSTPRPLFEALASQRLDWDRVHLVQVDERVVGRDSPERNLVDIERLLRAPLADAGTAPTLHPMPVDGDADAGALRYADELAAVAGEPPVIDVVHLGLGADGHTASLVPGDAGLLVVDRDVTVTAPYQGRPRMTLTFPAIARSRLVVWFVTGAGKAPVTRRLVDGDTSIPAARIATPEQILVCDRAAGADLVDR